MTQPTIRHYTTPPSYHTFLEDHLKPLVPCLIDGLIDDWPCLSTWRRRQSHSTSPHRDAPEPPRSTRPHDDERDSNDWVPDYDYLSREFGNHSVSVTTNNASTTSLSFRDFLASMRDGEMVYARDIHLMSAFPHHDIYRVPSLFRDDFLNFELLTAGKEDYRFLYIGSSGTRTTLHKDVVASHSWSSNITGHKIWTMIPPHATSLLYSADGQVPSDVFDQDDDEVTRAQWPGLEKVRNQVIRVDQAPNQTLFVPSGWFHQVSNVGATLSLNHNWINASSLPVIYDTLVREAQLSSESIRDLREDGVLDDCGFVRVVQELTCVNAGMDWIMFFGLVLCRLEREADYVDQRYRPPWEYEGSVIRGICERWSNSWEGAEWLPKVQEMVDRVLGLCDEKDKKLGQ